MTKQEHAYWQAIIAHSASNWTLDRIRFENTGEALIYKGGESGIFVWITRDGIATGGSYEGAFPHIGEAIFHCQHERRFASRDEAFTSLATHLGARFLAEISHPESAAV